MRLLDLPTSDATAIQKYLEDYKEKWDKFVALLKQDAHDYFEWRGMEHVYDSLAWTITHDAETLDGASYDRDESEISGVDRRAGERRVCKGASSPVKGSKSVADDAKAREPTGYFCKLVRESNVALATEAEFDEDGNGFLERIKRIELDEDEDEDELRDLRKKVKLDKVVDMYAARRRLLRRGKEEATPGPTPRPCRGPGGCKEYKARKATTTFATRDDTALPEAKEEVRQA
ncbi:hypothetical protein N658DRAFT_506826 [Parathielavia hyrcaniae]|uniref:Uncharacterized protein n=1 Tax=Parathielavia hyrcaniae TaxID=113614 RepID=A0AAN6T296_9PEZI|nr:hypothetical protein N658DRAFT_506826 [Parathielavia hyrcaniae]